MINNGDSKSNKEGRCVNNSKIILSILLPFVIGLINIGMAYYNISILKFIGFGESAVRSLFITFLIELFPSIILIFSLKNVPIWIKLLSIIFAYPLYWMALLFMNMVLGCALGMGCF